MKFTRYAPVREGGGIGNELVKKGRVSSPKRSIHREGETTLIHKRHLR